MFSRALELKKVRSSEDTVSSTVTAKKVVKSLPKTSKIVPKAEKVRKDFFGRVIEAKKVDPGSTSLETSTSTESKSELFGVYYKFKEGFSNAVRRNLKIKQIL